MLSRYYSDVGSKWNTTRKRVLLRRSEPLSGPKGPGTSKKGALSSNRYNIGQALRDTLSMLAPTCGWLGVGYIADLGVLEPVYSLRATDPIMQHRRVCRVGVELIPILGSIGPDCVSLNVVPLSAAPCQH